MQMQPIVDRLEEVYGEQIKFVRLDAYNEGERAFEVGNFPGHPAFLMMQPDGKEVWRKFGVIAYNDFETAILNILE